MNPVKAEFGLDSTTEVPSNMVVLTIAAHTNQKVDDLPPLYYSVDPDALDSVVNSMDDGHVSFSYAGYMLTVNASGEVSIESPNE